MSNRGLEKLIGRVVEHVDSRAFQMVHLYLNDGSVVSINTDGFH